MEFKIEDILKKWDNVLQIIKETKITAHAWLVNGDPVQLSRNKLITVFKNKMHMETIKKANNKELVEQSLFKVFKHKIEILCIMRIPISAEQNNNIDTIISEFLLLLDNGTKLNNINLLINYLNLDSEYTIATQTNLGINDYRGIILINGVAQLEIEINKYVSNQGKDIVYKVGIYSLDVETHEIYIDHFVELLQNNKFIKSKYVLWDGVSHYYCNKGYTLINKVENKMRSFIMEFLTRKIGQNAFQETVSEEIKESIKNNNQSNRYKTFNTLLFNAEFRELGDFLFKEFDSFKDKKAIIDEIRKCSNIEQLNKLKELMPNSNWNRYFD
jgi:hypothetical protein